MPAERKITRREMGWGCAFLGCGGGLAYCLHVLERIKLKTVCSEDLEMSEQTCLTDAVRPEKVIEVLRQNIEFRRIGEANRRAIQEILELEEELNNKKTLRYSRLKYSDEAQVRWNKNLPIRDNGQNISLLMMEGDQNGGVWAHEVNHLRIVDQGRRVQDGSNERECVWFEGLVQGILEGVGSVKVSRQERMKQIAMNGVYFPEIATRIAVTVEKGEIRQEPVWEYFYNQLWSRFETYLGKTAEAIKYSKLAAQVEETLNPNEVAWVTEQVMDNSVCDERFGTMIPLPWQLQTRLDMKNLGHSWMVMEQLE